MKIIKKFIIIISQKVKNAERKRVPNKKKKEKVPVREIPRLKTLQSEDRI